MKMKPSGYDNEMVMMYNDEMSQLICTFHISNLSVNLIRDLENLNETSEESITVDFCVAY